MLKRAGFSGKTDTVSSAVAGAGKPGYWPALTGIRAVAALMVYLHHFNPVLPGHFLYYFFNELHVGVAVFFVLSGFLIGSRYGHSVQLSKGWLARYFRNRMARIYPVYLLVTTSAFFWLWLQGGKNGHLGLLYLLNITFAKGFFAEFIFTGIPQGWTLTVEMVFYLLAPFILFMAARHKRWLPVLPVCFMAVGLGLVFAFQDAAFYGFFDSYRFLWLYTFFGRCLEFFVGLALALFLRNRPAYFPRFKAFTLAGMVSIAGCVWALAAVRENQLYGLYEPAGIFLNNVCLPIGIGLLLLGLMQEKTILRQFLAAKPMILLGQSSYTFYLAHFGVFHYLVATQVSQHYALRLLLLAALSAFIYHVFERPLNHYFRKKSFN